MRAQSSDETTVAPEPRGQYQFSICEPVRFFELYSQAVYGEPDSSNSKPYSACDLRMMLKELISTEELLKRFIRPLPFAFCY